MSGPELDRWIAALRDEGLLHADIARRVGRNIKVVAERLSALGYPPRVTQGSVSARRCARCGGDRAVPKGVMRSTCADCAALEREQFAWSYSPAECAPVSGTRQ